MIDFRFSLEIVNLGEKRLREGGRTIFLGLVVDRLVRISDSHLVSFLEFF